MVERFCISLESGLLASFDRFVGQHRYQNRSEAVRDLFRKAMVDDEWTGNRDDVMGVITLVYDHHRRNLLNRIAAIQHDCPATIVSTTHVHMDHHNCLEVIIAKGKPVQVSALADSLKALRGVKSGTLSPASTGKRLT